MTLPRPGSDLIRVEIINRSSGTAVIKRSIRSSLIVLAISAYCPVVGISENTTTEKSNKFHPSPKYRLKTGVVAIIFNKASATKTISTKLLKASSSDS